MQTKKRKKGTTARTSVTLAHPPPRAFPAPAQRGINREHTYLFQQDFTTVAHAVERQRLQVIVQRSRVRALCNSVNHEHRTHIRW